MVIGAVQGRAYKFETALFKSVDHAVEDVEASGAALIASQGAAQA